MIEYLMGLVTGICVTIASLLVSALRDGLSDTPVEGIDGLDASLGRDLPTAEVPRPRAGTIYTGSHRRKGPSRWLAHLGRTHRGWSRPKAGRLP